jgi:ElaB/YqjD/DUF883 family membrane-anchored ribosome-binding protein
MAGTPESEMRKDLNEDLKRDLELLREDVANLTDTLKGIVDNERASVRAHLNAATEKVVNQGEQFAQAATDQFASSRAQLEESIVRNPIQAILIALGLGFLIGVLRR